MKTRHVLFIIFFVAALIAAFILLSININPAVSVSLPADTLETQPAQEQPTRTASQAEGETLAEAGPAPSPEMPRPDAQALLQSRCTRCHMMGWLNQIKQSRTDWETILVRMESFKVQLNEQEKAALLDYLAVQDAP